MLQETELTGGKWQCLNFPKDGVGVWRRGRVWPIQMQKAKGRMTEKPFSIHCHPSVTERPTGFLQGSSFTRARRLFTER